MPILRPDYVVVDVDETDLYDDFVRYRELIVRNDRGQNVAVKGSSIDLEFGIGLMKAREHRLYLMRLVAKLWHIYVHMPALYRKYRAGFGWGVLSIRYLIYRIMIPTLKENIPTGFRSSGRICKS